MSIFDVINMRDVREHVKNLRRWRERKFNACMDRISGWSGELELAPLRCEAISINQDKTTHPCNAYEHQATEKHLENWNFSKNYFWSAGSAGNRRF